MKKITNYWLGLMLLIMFGGLTMESMAQNPGISTFQKRIDIGDGTCDNTRPDATTTIRMFAENANPSCADTVTYCFFVTAGDNDLANVEISDPQLDPFLAGGIVATYSLIPAGGSETAIVTVPIGSILNLQPGNNQNIATLTGTVVNAANQPVGAVNETDQGAIYSIPVCEVSIAAGCPANLTLECPASTDATPSVTELTCTLNGISMPTLPTTYTVVDTTMETGLLDGCGLGTITNVVSFTYGAPCAALTFDSGPICTQAITVVDSTPPTFTVPADVTLDCEIGLDTSTNATGFVTDAADTCDAAPVISFTEVMTPGNCSGVMVITRDWMVTDCAGLSSNAVQTITVQDITAPVITCPADEVIDCATPYDAATVYGDLATASDVCDVAPVITYVDGTPVVGTCPANFTVERVFTATDCSLNSSTCTQLLTFADTTAPAIPAPTTIAFDCIAAVEGALNSITNGIADDCSSFSFMTTVTVVSSNCLNDQLLSVDIMAMDGCGNATTSNIVITISDTNAPMFTLVPDAIDTMSCEEADPTAAISDVVAMDNCLAPVVVTLVTNETLTGVCPLRRSFEFVWTATDDCGNTADYTSTVFYVDTTPPTITACPIQPAVECTNDVTFLNDLDQAGALDYFFEIGGAVTDLCSTVTLTKWSEANVPNGANPLNNACDTTIVQCFVFEDDCMNVSTCLVEHVVIDLTAPDFACPANQTLECDFVGLLPTNTFQELLVSAMDNCGGDLSISSRVDVGMISCNGRADSNVVYWVSDICGNEISCTQIFSFADTMPPMIGCPANGNIEACVAADVPLYQTLADFLADGGTTNDNCGIDQKSFMAVQTSGGTCPIFVTNTYTILDFCGNTGVCEQVVTVSDTTAPTFDCPQAVMFNCTEPIDFTILGEPTSPVDNCDPAPVISMVGIFTNDGDCIAAGSAGEILRVFAITDACGNSNVCTQVISVVDTTAPTLTVSPVAVDCTTMVSTSNVPAFPGGKVIITTDPNTGNPNTLAGWPGGNQANITNHFGVLPVSPTWQSFMAVPGMDNPLTIVELKIPCGVYEIAWTSDVPFACYHYIDPNFDMNFNMPNYNMFPPAAYTPVSIGGIGPGIGSISAPGASPFVATNILNVTQDCSDGSTIHTVHMVFSAFTPGAGTIANIQGSLVAAPFEPMVCVATVDPAPSVVVSDNCSAVSVTTSFIGSATSDPCTRIYRNLVTACDSCGNCTSAVQVITQIDTNAPVAVLATPVTDFGCLTEPPVIPETCECPTGSDSVTNVSDEIDVVVIFTGTELLDQDAVLIGGTGTSVPLVPFRSDIVAAHAAGNGGVQNFTPAIGYNPGSPVNGDEVSSIELINGCTTLTLTEGRGLDFQIRETERSTGPNSIAVDNTGAYDGELVIDLAATGPNGPIGVTQFGFALLEPDAPFNAVDNYFAEFQLDDGTAGTLQHSTYTDDGDDEDAWFGYKAPAGRSIVRVIIRGARDNDPENDPDENPDSDFNIDDLAYVTSCAANTGLAGIFTSVTDDCDNGVTVSPAVPFEQTVVDGCRTTLERLYDVSDACGNTTTVTQKFTWTGNDINPPTMVDPITPVNVGCRFDLIPSVEIDQAAVFAGATDDCALASIEFVKETFSAVNEDCEQYIGRTFRIYDECGNFLECTHEYIYIVDNENPLIFADDLNLGCNPNYVPTPLEFEGITATDDCTLRRIIYDPFTSTAVTNDCTITLVRRYWAEDQCGHFSTLPVNQTVTYSIDNLPPEVVWPADGVFCVSNLVEATEIANSDMWSVSNAIAQMTAVDDCSIASTNFLGSHTSAVVDCGMTITRFFRVLDGCGMAVDGEQTLSFTVDGNAPVLLIDDLDLGCNPQYIFTPNELEGIQVQESCGFLTVTGIDASVVSQGNGDPLDCLPCAVTLAVGDRVTLLVDNPDGAPGLLAGTEGTVICGDSIDPLDGPTAGGPPLLVSWDGFTGGNDITNFCNCGSSAIPLGGSGWWLDCAEVSLIPPPPPPPVSGANTTNGHKLLIRMYVATDACGNSTTGSQFITWVDDYEPPVFTAFPSGGYVGCGKENVPVADVTDVIATDFVQIFSTQIVSDVTNAMPGGCLWQVTRLYRAMDECGNAREKEIVWTYTDDPVKPVFTDLPQVIDLGCNPSGGVPVSDDTRFEVTDNCTVASVSAMPDPLPTLNGCTYTMVRSYVAIDGCGNSETGTVSYSWSVDLSTPFVSYNYTGNLGCLDLQALTPSLIDSSVTIDQTYQSDELVAPGNGGIETPGASSTFTPAVGGPDEAQFAGRYDIDVEATSVEFVFNQNFTVVPAILISPQPAGTFDRYYVTGLNFGPGVNLIGATVAAGSSLVPNVTVTGSDSFLIEIGPGLNIGPGQNFTVDLQTTTVPGSLPSTTTEIAAITAGATDTCSSPTVSFVEVATASNECQTTMIRTYRVSDACNNFTDLEVTYSWLLNAETLSATIAGINPVMLGCNPTVPAVNLADVTVSGQETCGDVVVAHIGDSTVLGTCNLNIERVFSVTDDCESITVTQVFVGIQDLSAGMIDITTPELDLGCANMSDVPDPADVDFFASTNCDTLTIDDAVITVVTQVRTACETVIDHFYEFTDQCGNNVRASRRIRLQELGQDTEAPVFVDSPIATPQTIDLGCNPAELPTPDVSSISVTDNCSVDNVFWLMDVDPGTGIAPFVDGAGECFRTNRRYYVASDICGNVSTGLVIYTWKVDVDAPSIVQVRPELFGDLGCNPTARGINIEPDTANVFAMDNCDGAIPAVLMTDQRFVNGCENTVVYIYRFTDSCGNRVDHRVQFRYTVDVTAPAISTSPAPQVDLGCNPTVIPNPDYSQFAVSDDCVSMTRSVDRQQTFNNCAVTIVDTYTWTDGCDNTTVFIQTITYTADTGAPVFSSFPLDMDLGCNPSAPPAPFTGVVATDLCGATTESVSAVVLTNGCVTTMIRTYSSVDGCGNATSQDHTMTWTTDTTPPVFVDFTTQPVINLGCNPTPVPTPDTTSFDVTDDCQVVDVRFVSDSVTSVDCEFTMVRTFVAADACGNSNIQSQTYVWTVDVEGPVITSVGPEGDLGCNPDSIPAADVSLVSATDNCTISSTNLIIDSVSTNGCTFEAYRLYRVIDECGNVADRAQVLTWTMDSEAPTINPSPVVDLGCNPSPVPPADASTVSATDDCQIADVQFLSSVTNITGCSYTMVRTFTVADACGNMATGSQTFVWTQDTKAPVITSVGVEGDLGPNPASIPAADVALVTATDDCQLMNITLVVDQESNNGCQFEATRVYRAMDACGNFIDRTQVLTWTIDSAPPTIDCPPDIELGNWPPLIPTPNFGLVVTSDDCGVASVTYVTNAIVNSGVDYTQTYVIMVTDNSGKTAECIHTITWTQDGTPPVVGPGGEPLESSITGTVWTDLNNNQTVDDGQGQLLGGVTVSLINTNGTVVDTVITDTNGFYAFTAVAPGVYDIQVDGATLPATPIANTTTPASLPLTIVGGAAVQAQNFGYIFTGTTAIDLLAFEATVGPAGVSVTWQSASDADTLGYNLYRDGEQVNAALILVNGSGLYTVEDAGSIGGEYVLESIDNDLSTDTEGPILPSIAAQPAGAPTVTVVAQDNAANFTTEAGVASYFVLEFDTVPTVTDLTNMRTLEGNVIENDGKYGVYFSTDAGVEVSVD